MKHHHQATIDYLESVVIPRIDAIAWCDGQLRDPAGSMCLIGYLGVVDKNGEYVAPDEIIGEAVNAVAAAIDWVHPWNPDPVSPITRCWEYNDRELTRHDDPRDTIKKLIEKTIRILKKE